MVSVRVKVRRLIGMVRVRVKVRGLVEMVRVRGLNGMVGFRAMGCVMHYASKSSQR